MEHKDKDQFFYPRARYYGGSNNGSNPRELLFNANLQEFSQRISILCNLETAGKISTEEAYTQIRSLWKQLKHSKRSLDIE